MSRTRFPGWRAIGILLALNNAVWLLFAFQLVLPDSSAIGSVGGFSRACVPYDEAYLTLVFCLGVTGVGALASLKWPCRGFALLGAGYLFGALSLLVLFHWTRPQSEQRFRLRRGGSLV